MFMVRDYVHSYIVTNRQCRVIVVFVSIVDNDEQREVTRQVFKINACNDQTVLGHVEHIVRWVVFIEQISADLHQFSLIIEVNAVIGTVFVCYLFLEARCSLFCIQENLSIKTPFSILKC